MAAGALRDLLDGDIPVGSKKQILVVDDDADIRDVVKVILTKAGYICEYAKDGAEAFDKVGSDTFDLIVLDLNMPRMCGQEFISKMAKSGRNIPIIIITAQANPASIFKGLAASYRPMELLSKPFMPNELIEKVEKYVES